MYALGGLPFLFFVSKEFFCIFSVTVTVIIELNLIVLLIGFFSQFIHPVSLTNFNLLSLSSLNNKFFIILFHIGSELFLVKYHTF